MTIEREMTTHVAFPRIVGEKDVDIGRERDGRFDRHHGVASTASSGIAFVRRGCKMSAMETGAGGGVFPTVGSKVVVDIAGLQRLFDTLRSKGYTLVGPTVRDEAVVYGEIRSVEDLPRGWTDEQEKGLYRLRRREDDALFGYAVGPHSWKMFLNPSARRLWRSTREGKGFRIDAEKDEQPPMAFIGVRACELSAMAIQDKVFLGGQWIDPLYRRRREGAFIVAVNCGTASGT